MIKKSRNLMQFIEKLLSENPSSFFDSHKTLRDESGKLKQIQHNDSPEYESMLRYTGDGYKYMNYKLRKDKYLKAKNKVDRQIGYDDEDEVDNHIENLKKLTKNPTEHEFYTYRGMASSKKFKPGDIIHDKGFTSTSLNSYVAQGFKGGHKTQKLFRIHVNPGTKGIYTDGHGYDKNALHEQEFLLHPGTKFKVGDVSRVNGTSYINLHIHSQEE